jgi:mannosyltransferase OCH1-like enzyme
MNNYFSDSFNSQHMKEIKQRKITDIKIGEILKYRNKVPYPIKETYNPVIPLNIYQTWHTKELPISMKNAVNKIIYINTEFNHCLFDDDDCRNFIKENFNHEVLKAFDSLIPGAYKADLWRYCILYKNGGIYLDIKYEPVLGFKFISLSEKEHFVLDADKKGIYNALMVCKPNNEILLKAINKIVENVKNKFYGNSPLEPTGPLMLEKLFTDKEKQNFDIYHDFYLSIHNRFIFINDYIVLKSYKSYQNEHDNNKKVSYYNHLWINRNIYK